MVVEVFGGIVVATDNVTHVLLLAVSLCTNDVAASRCTFCIPTSARARELPRHTVDAQNGIAHLHWSQHGDEQEVTTQGPQCDCQTSEKVCLLEVHAISSLSLNKALWCSVGFGHRRQLFASKLFWMAMSSCLNYFWSASMCECSESTAGFLEPLLTSHISY